jgi:hypothetical protein
VSKKVYTVENPEERPEITEIRENLIIFADGSKFDAEIIIWCSGYQYSFPFFKELPVYSNPSRVHIYKHVFLTASMAFIGNVTHKLIR